MITYICNIYFSHFQRYTEQRKPRTPLIVKIADRIRNAVGFRSYARQDGDLDVGGAPFIVLMLLVIGKTLKTGRFRADFVQISNHCEKFILCL